MRRASWAMALIICLPGCAEQGPGDAVPGIEFPIMDVETTAYEPKEEQGFIRVGWSESGFAIDAQYENDLPRFLMRLDDTFYTTENARAWVSYPAGDTVPTGLSPRGVAWDLRGLLAADLEREVTKDGPEQVIRVQGKVGGSIAVDATLRVVDGVLEEAALEAPLARESPFRFVRSTQELSFPLEPPEPTRAAASLSTTEAQAAEAHRTVTELVDQYADRRGGSLPASLDPETFRLELLTGGEWPDNPYTGRPLREGDGSGDISWRRCSDTQGLYVGHGWDLDVQTREFGGGCD